MPTGCSMNKLMDTMPDRAFDVGIAEAVSYTHLAAAEKGEKDRHVVAIIGDGSMSGGLAFEGLNNAS